MANGYARWVSTSLVVAGLALVSGGGEALAAPWPEDWELQIDPISIEEGLSQSTVFCMLRDSRGFLWLGTEDGLNKYDGYDFRIYRSVRGDPATLSDNWISDLLEDHEGQLWVVTQKGLDRFDRATGRVVRFVIPSQGESPQAWSLHEDRRGQLWLTTDGGVFLLNRSVKRLEQVNLPKGKYRFVTEDTEGTLWFGTWGDGMLALDPKTGASRSYRQGRPEADKIRVIKEQADGRLWVGTASGLYIFDRVRGLFQEFGSETLSTFAELGRVHITALYDDRLGRRWIGTRNDGLFILDLKAGRIVHLTSKLDSPARLANETVWSIMEDPSGLLWLGHGTGGGLSRLTERRFHNEAHNPTDLRSLSHDAVWSILEDRRGGLWVGTTGGLNYRAPGATGFERFQADRTSRIPLPDARVWALAESVAGEIWIGTFESGIVRYDPETGTSKHLSADALGSGAIRVLETGHDGTIWIGTDGGGLSAFNPRSETLRTYLKTTNPSSGLSDNRIWAILETRSGELWLGTDGSGVDVFRPDKGNFRHYTSDEGNPKTIGGNHAWSIYEDRQGRIWVGAKDGGLNLFQESCDCFRRYTKATHDLPNDTVYGILEDRDGTLWLSTNHGLSNFNPDTGRFINYDVHDGLPTNEFDFGAYHQDSTGRKFFGSIRGITSFFEIEPGNNYQPPVVITELTLESGLALEELAPGQALILASSDDHFSFLFAALDYRSPNSIRYEYQLQGIDRAPRKADARKRVASYSFLSPGTYTFEVRGTNRDGEWSEHVATAQVIVPAAFWQRRSFWAALVALVLIFVLIQLRRRRERHRKLQRRLFEGREAERSEVADLIHEGPIQSIITVRNQVGSPDIQRDLERVGRELRDICWEMSRPPKLAEVGLATAIYDHLHGLREGRRPLPKIDVEVDDDVDEYLRPSNLLVAYRIYQKGLNNAIQHAEATHVTVRVRRIGDFFLLEVEDDGVGFEVRWSQLSTKHYGLLSSRDAAKSVGGKLEVKLTSGGGTVFRAWLPVRRSYRRFRLYSFRNALASVRSHLWDKVRK